MSCSLFWLVDILVPHFWSCIAATWRKYMIIRYMIHWFNVEYVYKLRPPKALEWWFESIAQETASMSLSLEGKIKWRWFGSAISIFRELVYSRFIIDYVKWCFLHQNILKFEAYWLWHWIHLVSFWYLETYFLIWRNLFLAVIIKHLMAHPLMFWDNVLQLHLNGYYTKDATHFKAIFAGLCMQALI